MSSLTGRAAALLEAVHANPRLTRADAARRLGIGSGATTELVAKLTAAGLLSEMPAAPTGTRGRPTTVLVAHPNGPVVAAAAITQESWQVDAVELGGEVIASVGARHDGRDGQQTLSALAEAVRRLRRRMPGRVRGVGISVPGTVLAGRVLNATNLGWRDLDLRAVWPRAELFVADNDATLAALAESCRGAAREAALSVHLRVEAGLGGGVIDHDRVLRGARGVAGEFGHMPFGDADIACPCGARGCWGTAVDGTALARLLAHRKPRDPVTYARRVIALAEAGGPAEAEAVRTVAAALGRGIAGLVNGMDPDLVTLGGLGADLLATASEALHAAYREGLMNFRQSSPPPVIAATLGEAGPLVGAAEEVWSRLWRQLQI